MRIESVHRLLLKMNQSLLIFELSSELFSLLLEFLESLLISLDFVHVEGLPHASTSLASLGFGESCEEAVLIVYKELSLNLRDFLGRQIVLGKVSMIAVSHSRQHIKHELLITSTVLQMQHETANRTFERIVECVEIWFN